MSAQSGYGRLGIRFREVSPTLAFMNRLKDVQTHCRVAFLGHTARFNKPPFSSFLAKSLGSDALRCLPPVLFISEFARRRGMLDAIER